MTERPPEPPRVRVLLLEDNPDDADLLLLALRRGGVVADARCVDDEAGFRDGLADAPDVVLADYNVPGFGAMDALRLLRERAEDTPLVVVSGAIGEDVAVAAMRAGAVDYVLKDRMARLAQAVDHALESRRLREAARRAEQALREAKETAEAARAEAESANRWKTAFLSMVSHDVRTPLTAVVGYVDLLREGIFGALTPQQAEALDSVAEAAARLLALLDDILDFSRIEANRLTLAPEPIDLPGLLHTLSVEFAGQARAKGIDLVVRAPAPLPRPVADPLRLRQVLANLVGNAVKFTEQGAVTLSAEAADGAVRIAVADTGPGIEAAALGRLFDEFEQADPTTARRHGGSGLGLAIAKRLVDLHDGSISVASRPGAGSVFTVELPLAGAASLAAG